jgi:hypothetical protein
LKRFSFQVGQSILSPLFNVKELRDLGVTLHILLNSERDPVPGKSFSKLLPLYISNMYFIL